MSSQGTPYTALQADLRAQPKTWLVTGAAGFIGSHLCEKLLGLGQRVVALDNFATGSPHNIEMLRRHSGDSADAFLFIEGDICDPEACARAVSGVELVLHQAALGSVPRSIDDPATSNRVNVGGFIEILSAAQKAGVKRFVYASSSSVFGDITDAVKTEDRLGRPLSPYAASKRADELYAESFANSYGIECVGLRYFNVFGPRQSPDGPYAAVIPRWLSAISRGEPCVIFGDGQTSRDFCFVENVVQANLLAATAKKDAANQAYNIAVGEKTNLLELHAALREASLKFLSGISVPAPEMKPFRNGDVRHSLADISKAQKLLGYVPEFRVGPGLELTAEAFFASERQ
ncbi:MAG: SDR family oxidoreductase [Bdellovibrionota bacterium]